MQIKKDLSVPATSRLHASALLSDTLPLTVHALCRSELGGSSYAGLVGSQWTGLTHQLRTDDQQTACAAGRAVTPCRRTLN